MTVAVGLLLAWKSAAADVEYGLASKYVEDLGIDSDTAVIAATGFETEQWAQQTFNHSRNLPEGYGHTADPAIVFSGKGSMEIQQT